MRQSSGSESTSTAEQHNTEPERLISGRKDGMKQQKILSVTHGSTRIECIQRNDTDRNPYKIYLVWYDRRWHRRIMNSYQDFTSVLYYLLDFQNACLERATPEQKLAWAKRYK